jgi:exocyst complex component 4
VSFVSAMDSHGLARMQLNVLVLQQTLKAVQSDASLEWAKRFYEMGALGKEVVAKGGSEGYEEESLGALGRLVG